VNAKGKFVSTLLTIDTFFISFAVGFNSHPVLVVDPSLPPLKTKPAAKVVTTSSKPSTAAKSSSTHQPGTAKQSANAKIKAKGHHTPTPAR
jgi:hypothetical protein